MKKSSGIFQEKIILSFVMCVLLCIVLFAATTAWYASNNAVKTHGLQLAADGIGGIRVAVEAGGEDISRLPDKTSGGIPVIPIKLTELNNIREDMIAPGAYGPMTFYITALGETITGYSIKVQLAYQEEEAADKLLSEEQRRRLEEIIKEHITVYTVMEKGSTDAAASVAGSRVKFSEPLLYYTDENALDGSAATGELKVNEEVKAELYWVWNYEYTDIPGNEGTALPGEEAGLKQKNRQYDEEDTLLGNYIDNIWFNVYIQGITAAKE